MPNDNADNGADHANDNSAHFEPEIVVKYGIFIDDPQCI